MDPGEIQAGVAANAADSMNLSPGVASEGDPVRHRYRTMLRPGGVSHASRLYRPSSGAAVGAVGAWGSKKNSQRRGGRLGDGRADGCSGWGRRRLRWRQSG